MSTTRRLSIGSMRDYNVNIQYQRKFWRVYSGEIRQRGLIIETLYANTEKQLQILINTWLHVNQTTNLAVLLSQTLKHYQGKYKPIKLLRGKLQDNTSSVFSGQEVTSTGKSSTALQLTIQLLSDHNWKDIPNNLLVILTSLSGLNSIQSIIHIYQQYYNSIATRISMIGKVVNKLQFKGLSINKVIKRELPICDTPLYHKLVRHYLPQY